MSPFRKIFGSLLVVGLVTAGGVACGSDDSSASIEAWCEKFKAYDEGDEVVDDDGLDDFVKSWEELAKDAPAEVSDDMNYMASIATSTIDEADYSDEKMEAASDRVEAFVKDKCGFELNAD